MPQPASSFPQRERGMMVYPRNAWRRWFFRAPLFAWRFGFGWLLGKVFLVLTTTGRKSGRPRHTMLEFSFVDGRTYIGSGWGPRTDWMRNIERDPRVTVQVRGKTFAAFARHVSDDPELLRFFNYARGRSPVWKDYLASLGIEDTPADFIAKKERLTILRLDTVTEAGPPGLRADLVWVWLLVIAGAVVLFRLI